MQSSSTPKKPPIGCHIRRTRLPAWLTSRINSREVPGLEWIDRKSGLFKIPWKHSGKHDWTPEQSQIFKEWAIHTEKYKEGDEPNYAKWKTNFRCALYKAEDIEHQKEPFINCNIETQPYKIFRFKPKKRRSIPIDTKECQGASNMPDNIPIFVSNYDSSSGSSHSSQSQSMMHTTGNSSTGLRDMPSSESGDQTFNMGPSIQYLNVPAPSGQQNNVQDIFSSFAMDQDVPLSPSDLVQPINPPPLYKSHLSGPFDNSPAPNSGTKVAQSSNRNVTCSEIRQNNGITCTAPSFDVAYTQSYSRPVPSNNMFLAQNIGKSALNDNFDMNKSINSSAACSPDNTLTPHNGLFHKFSPNDNAHGSYKEVMKVEYMCTSNNLPKDNSSQFRQVQCGKLLSNDHTRSVVNSGIVPNNNFQAYENLPLHQNTTSTNYSMFSEDGGILKRALLGMHTSASVTPNTVSMGQDGTPPVQCTPGTSNSHRKHFIGSNNPMTRDKVCLAQGASYAPKGNITTNLLPSIGIQSKIENQHPTLTSLEKVQAFNNTCRNSRFPPKQDSEVKGISSFGVNPNHPWPNPMFYCESSNSSDTSASVDMSVTEDDSFMTAARHTSLSEHLCHSDKGMIVELYYRQSRRCQWHVSNPEGCRLIYKVIPEAGPPELTYKLFGYKFDELQVLEMPTWPTGFGNEVVCTKANQVLQNLERGIILQVSENGDIHATRLCKTSVYCSSPVGDGHAYRLERDEQQTKIKVFDYARFLSDFENYNKSKTCIPSASIHFYFGQKSTVDDRDKILVMAKITSCKALLKINTEEGQQQLSSIHISHPDQYDDLGDCMKRMQINKSG